MKKVIYTSLALSCFAILSSSPSYSETRTVEVLSPRVAEQHIKVELTGSISAIQNAQLAPMQAGLVADIYAEQGDVVQQGDKLLQLDAKLAELTLSQHQAKLAGAKSARVEAERLYKEVVALSKKQFVAETTMAQRRSAYQVAQANLAQAKAEHAYYQELLARHTLYAPFTGVVVERHLDLGEWVSQQSVAFSLVEQNRLRLELDVPEQYFAQVQPGVTKVSINANVQQANTIEATVSRKVAVADSLSRTFKVLVDLPAQAALFSGASAQAQLTLSAANNIRVYLPKSAIKQHPDGGHSVFVLQQNKAKRVLVELLAEQDEQVLVTGVAPNSQVVASGVELLKQGDALTAQGQSGAKL